MRVPFICGNWKMYKTIAQATEFANAVLPDLAKISGVDVGIGAPFTQLAALTSICKNSNLQIGAQDCYWEKEGAFTGEIAANMLADAGCNFVIIGHSERRQYFGETDETVNRKTKAALESGLTAIVCVGETLQEREQNITSDIVVRQLTGGLSGITAEQLKKIVIAYEPVWAIGTGKTATPEQAEEVHQVIRGQLVKLFAQASADAMRILYGGSVKPGNVKELMAKENIDGALVGGASLIPADFLALCNFNK